MRELFGYLLHIQSCLRSFPLDDSFFPIMKSFYELELRRCVIYRVMCSFVQRQIPIFLPLRDQTEAQMYVQLLNLFVAAIRFPSISTQIHAIACVESLYPNPCSPSDLDQTCVMGVWLRPSRIQTEAVPAITDALLQAVQCHIPSSPCYLAVGSSFYSSVIS